MDGRRTYISSDMATKSSGMSPGNVRDTMPKDLVSEALRRALAVRRPPAGLLVHSDQGSWYTATRFKDLVIKRGAQQRMSRRGNCSDNAHAESVCRRFKTEMLDGAVSLA